MRALSTEISLAAGSTLFELAGSQATLAEHGLTATGATPGCTPCTTRSAGNTMRSATTTSTMKTRRCGDHLMSKKILLNAFNMNCIGHINHGLWTHPRDTSTHYNTLEYWTELAQILERGLFDGLFIADIVGVYDVYQDSIDVPPQGVDPVTGQRPSAAGVGHGRCHQALGLRPYRQPHL